MGEHAEFRIADGDVLVYRLFDVADAVDLAAAERLVAAPASRLALSSAGSLTAIELPRPPLHVTLGEQTIPLRAGPRAALASARVYDFGVVSVVYRLRIEAGTPLRELVPLAEELFVDPSPALEAAARRVAEEVSTALGRALEKPHVWDGFESFHVVLVRDFEEPVRAAELLRSAPLPELVLGETSAIPLSPAERHDVLSHQLSYLEDDLAVVHWNSAFVLEPSGVEDIPDLLEVATAHLLELRYYDALLDRELHRIYDVLEAGGAPVANIFTRRYRRLQREVASLLLELSETVERLENAVKIVGDFYLARVYQSAVRRFRLPAWQETVLRKQRLVAEVNDLLGNAADTSRAELLELTIVLLILYEIVAAVFR